MGSPTRRAALAAGVAALLVTAGCLGVTVPTDTGTSSTPDTANCTYDATTTTTESGTWSSDVSVDQYPPGVADNGTLTNVSTLLDAHFDVTANQSMELRMESTRGNIVQTLVHGPDRTPFYSTAEEGPEGERVRTEFYKTDSLGLAKSTFDNETMYSVYQNTSTGGLGTVWNGYETFRGLEGPVYSLLYNGKFSVNGTVERGDRTFVELRPDEDSVDARHPPKGRALVTPDGVVYDVNISLVQTGGDDAGERFETSMSLNTDAEWCGAPSWVGSIPQLSLSIVEDGHAVEIRNTGGATLPANTTFDVVGSDEAIRNPNPYPVRGDVKGNVTLDERLEPGDTVYVTAGADGSPSSFALHDDPTRGEYSFGYAGLIGGQENVSYRLATGINPWPYDG